MKTDLCPWTYDTGTRGANLRCDRGAGHSGRTHSTDSLVWHESHSRAVRQPAHQEANQP